MALDEKALSRSRIIAVLHDHIDIDISKDIDRLSSDEIGESKPLPRLNYRKFTPANHLYLRSLGYKNRDIINALDISRSEYDKFIKLHELSARHIDYKEVSEWFFDDDSRTLPIIRDSDISSKRTHKVIKSYDKPSRAQLRRHGVFKDDEYKPLMDWIDKYKIVLYVEGLTVTDSRKRTYRRMLTRFASKYSEGEYYKYDVDVINACVSRWEYDSLSDGSSSASKFYDIRSLVIDYLEWQDPSKNLDILKHTCIYNSVKIKNSKAQV